MEAQANQAQEAEAAKAQARALPPPDSAFDLSHFGLVDSRKTDAAASRARRTPHKRAVKPPTQSGCGRGRCHCQVLSEYFASASQSEIAGTADAVAAAPARTLTTLHGAPIAPQVPMPPMPGLLPHLPKVRQANSATWT